MARLLPSNPLGYLINRQYDDRFSINKQDELVRARLNFARNLYKKDLTSHYGCVNAIEFSNKGEFLVSGGDDRRVLIWNLEKAIHGAGEPVAMQAQHMSNIFCLGFDSTNSKVFSGGNDDQVLVHDVQRGTSLDNFIHEQPVYGISIDPLNDNVFASACDDGRILIYDIREPSSTEPFCLAQHSSAFHGVMFNPVEPRVLTTANAKEGVGLWDVRTPKKILVHFGGQNSFQSCMSVRFNSSGTKILALRRRLPPVIYVPDSTAHLCQFDHAGYYNSCTMKSCSFAGDEDQYILSGSDNFNLYMWKVPSSEDSGQWIGSAHMVLEGHRSIVNQVRFDPTRGIIASSGVEKLIKLWSPFKMPHSTGSLYRGVEERSDERKVYTHEEYINLVLRSGEFMSHDYTSRSTQEDPRMMAFFDSLVQREIEGWTSEDGSSDESASDAAPAAPAVPAVPPILGDTHPQAAASAYSYVRGSDLQALAAAYVEAFEAVSPGVQEPNRISQLIARKRAQLMRLAQPRPAPAAPAAARPPDSADNTLVHNYSQPGSSGSQDPAVLVASSSNGSAAVRKRKRVSYSSESDSSNSWTSTSKIQKFINSYEIAKSSSSDSDGDEKNVSCLVKIYGKKRVVAPTEKCIASSSSDEEEEDRDGLNSDNVIPSSAGLKEDSSDEKNSGSDSSNLEVKEFVKKKSYSKNGSFSSIRKKSSKTAGDTVTSSSHSEGAILLNSTDISQDSVSKSTDFVPSSTNGDMLTVLKTASYESFMNDSVDSNCPLTQFYDSTSDEDFDEMGLTTPNSKIRNGANSTPDSGIAMGPCCSKSSVPFVCLEKSKRNLLSYDNDELSINGNSSKPNVTPTDNGNDSEWLPLKRLKSRLRGEGRNYRRYINDSDSN